MSILDDIYAIIWQLANYVAELLNELVTWISNALAQVLTFLQNAWNLATKAINDTLAFIRAMLDQLVDSLLAFATQLVNTITQAFQTAWNIVRDAVLNVLGAIGNFTNNLFASISANVKAIIDQIKFIFTGILDQLTRALDAVVQFIVDSYNGFITAVNEGIAAVLGFARDTLAALGQVISDSISVLITGPAAVFNALAERFNDIGTALRTAVGDLASALTGAAAEGREAVQRGVDDILGGLISWSNGPEVVAMAEKVRQLTSGGMNPNDYQAFVRNILQSFTPESALGRGIVFALLVAISAIPAGLNLASIYAQPMVQAVAKQYPYQLLATPDVVAAERRGFIGPNTATDILQRHGFSVADAETMRKLDEQPPGELDALHFWHRKLIGDEQLADVFKDRGFTTLWANVYKQASFIIPPPQDLITMAVREVFSPDVAARFGLFEDFPEQFAEFARQQGITGEWAQRYWGAHWGLPSATMGFEMFHRAIIGEDDLKLLLRSLDVMPFWRDRLIQLAYNPYTRVDIRRMHQLGVLTDDDVKRAHLDLGYSPEKADKLTEFVIRLNRNAPGEDDAELGRLSRAAVLGFYEDGILPRDRAHSLLINLGITPEAGSLYLDAVDNDQQRAERKAETDLVIAQAEAGLITFAQAESRLGQLGLETGEIQKALTRLTRSEQSKLKVPTRDDGERFFKLGLITNLQYFDLLQRLGYSNQWAQLYVAAAMREVASDKEQG